MTELNGTPVPPSVPAPPPPAYTPTSASTPGRTLAIVGLVFAFLSPLIGLILSIIAKVQSKNAGVKNSLATAGIIVSIVVGVIVTGILIALFATVFNQCAQLGPGVHVVGGVTYTCNV